LGKQRGIGSTEVKGGLHIVKVSLTDVKDGSTVQFALRAITSFNLRVAYKFRSPL
jgi:hypothetical protein